MGIWSRFRSPVQLPVLFYCPMEEVRDFIDGFNKQVGNMDRKKLRSRYPIIMIDFLAFYQARWSYTQTRTTLKKNVKFFRYVAARGCIAKQQQNWPRTWQNYNGAAWRRNRTSIRWPRYGIERYELLSATCLLQSTYYSCTRSIELVWWKD